MHVSKDSMWRKIWKILQNFLGTKQGPGIGFGRGGERGGRSRTDLKFCQCGWWAKRTHASSTNSVLYTQRRTHPTNRGRRAHMSLKSCRIIQRTGRRQGVPTVPHARTSTNPRRTRGGWQVGHPGFGRAQQLKPPPHQSTTSSRPPHHTTRTRALAPPKHKPQISVTSAAASFVCRGEERKWRRPRACSWGWATPSSTSPPSSTTPSWQSKRSSPSSLRLICLKEFSYS